MNEFVRLKQEDIRLVILKLLAQDPDYSHNEYILRRGLSIYGHKVSQDNLRMELAWLHEQGLVLRSNVGETVVVKLTMRGKDVAEGSVVVPGVQRPEPEGF